MLTEEKKSILQLLIALAWADGRVDQEELEVVEALLDAYDASTEEAKELKQWALVPRTLDDIDISCLSTSDLHLALQHGILLTHIDGEQSKEEIDLINKLVSKLGLPESEAESLIQSANSFAKSLLPELEA